MTRRVLFASILASLLAACGTDEPNTQLFADAGASDARADRSPDVLAEAPDATSDASDAALEATPDAMEAATDAAGEDPFGADCRVHNYCTPTAWPACDPETGHCVECIDDSTCTGNTVACDVARRLCTCAGTLTECETVWAPPKGRMCIDTTWAAQACGDCLHSCDAAQWCQSGECKCKPGYTQCGSGCTDMQTSLDHCGDCNTACADGERCEAGACKPGTTCTDAALTACRMGPRTSCADTTASPTNCGRCFRGCEGPLVCFESDCKLGWPATGCAACPCDTRGLNPFTNTSVAAPHCLAPIAAGAPPQCVE